MDRLNLNPKPSCFYLLLLLLSHGLALLVINQLAWSFAGSAALTFKVFLSLAVALHLVSLLRAWAGLTKQVIVRFEAHENRWLLWFADGHFVEAELIGEVLVWRYLVAARLGHGSARYWMLVFRDSVSAESHRRARAFLNLYGMPIQNGVALK